jgi:hypothetical protein
MLLSLKSNRVSASLWSDACCPSHGLLGDLLIRKKSRGRGRKVMVFEVLYLLSALVALDAFSAQPIVERRVDWVRFSTMEACLVFGARIGTTSSIWASICAVAEDGAEMSVKVIGGPWIEKTRYSDRYLPSISMRDW